jgi:hypothetical protein
MREGGTDVGGSFTDVPPVSTLRNGEPMHLRKVDRIDIAEQLSRLRRFLVVYVADPLEEQQRKDVSLPISAIDRTAAENVRAIPEM